jgi:hypothetical protein
MTHQQKGTPWSATSAKMADLNIFLNKNGNM